MNKTKILYAIAGITVALSIANLAYLAATTAKPQIINVTWRTPNSTIIRDEKTGEDILVYDYMIGIIPKYDPRTGKVKITSTTGLREKMIQNLLNNTVTMYFENVTRHNGTLIWPIWNKSNNKTTYYILKTEYYEGTWKGATIASPNGTIKTYNYTLENYDEFQQNAMEMLPKVEFRLSTQRNPLVAIIPTGGIIIAALTIIYAKVKESA